MTRPGYITAAEAAERMKVTEETTVKAIRESIIDGYQEMGIWYAYEPMVKEMSSNAKLLARLPLTADDLLCADCGELMARCTC